MHTLLLNKSIRRLVSVLLFLIILLGLQAICIHRGTDHVAGSTDNSTITSPISSRADAQEIVKDDSDKPPADEGSSDKKVAYLTFDDGPTQNTACILDILAKYDAKATFFLLEPQMRKYPEQLTQMCRAGHALGLHGVSHNHKKLYRSLDSVLDEMNTAQAKLQELTQVKSTLIRTPYGSKPYMKPAYMEGVKAAGYIVWDWNVDSRDWYYKDARLVDTTIEQIKDLEKSNINPVILFHDRGKTAEFLPQVLEYLVNNNYKFASLDTELEPVRF